MSGDHDIYTVEPDGSNLSRLTDDNTYLDIRPSWSPDGKKIVFERELVTGGRGKHWVMVMGADGSNIRKLPVRTRSSNVSWSPDGTKLTFDVGNPPNFDVRDIYMTDADGSNQINLTGSGNGHTPPRDRAPRARLLLRGAHPTHPRR